MTNEERNKQLEAEGMDWLTCVLGTVIIAVLIFAAVWGHAWVSAGMVP